MSNTLIWYRNDLRTHDHEPLVRASDEGAVLPFYCVDPRDHENTSYGFPKVGVHRARFLRESLQELRDQLRKMGADLIVRKGYTEEVIRDLVRQYGIDRIVAHKEATQDEIHRETFVKQKVNIPVELFWGSTLYHLEDLPFDTENMPDVFTSFRKKVEKYAEVRPCMPAPDKVQMVSVDIPGEIPLLTTPRETDERSVLAFKGGETAALSRLESYMWDGDHLKSYKKTRNGLLGPNYSSKFSPWLAMGCLSPRRIYEEVKKYEQERVSNDSTYWLIFELIWRDYFRFSAIKHGNRIFQKGGIQHKDRKWDINHKLFSAWAKGRTGIPFIDANMRELNQTGFMSNRGRQNVASFLAQNLNLDWRMGASYFESLLIDYDPCSNYGNWAYNATVGHDPRNRYFNIISQAQRYDQNGVYVRHWLPELGDIPDECIHEPHTMPEESQMADDLSAGIDYPEPIIDLDKSYEEIKARG